MPKQFCNHYHGMHETDSCDAGVEFSTLEHYGTAKFRKSCPCFGPEQTGKCQHKAYPTAEEMAEREAERKRSFEDTMKARAAIVDSLGGPWERGMEGSTGDIDCPVCGVAGALQFSRSGYNGHIHASCRTSGCVGWME